MINASGEATVHQAVRADHHQLINDKVVAEKKANQIRERRPVEKSEDGSKADLELKQNEETTTRHKIEDGRIILERYDEDGKLIRQIPPGYVPFGETA